MRRNTGQSYTRGFLKHAELPPLAPSSRQVLIRKGSDPDTPHPLPGDPRPVEETGLFIISVAARILEMHPQTLRKYERIGLVRPSRTVGMLRLYSAEDVAKLRLIKYMVEDEGLNLAGVEMILARLERLSGVRTRIYSLQSVAQFSTVVHEIEALLDALQPPFKP